MRNWRVIVAVAVAVVVSVVGYAQQRPRKTLSAQDYAEIQQLYARFVWGLDSSADNGMMYAKTYTPDGEYHFGSGQVRGWAELAQFIMKARALKKATPHLHTTSIWAEPSPEGARGGAYVVSVEIEEGKPVVKFTGTYEDILVKTADGWRIKRRTLHLNSMSPAGPAAW